MPLPAILPVFLLLAACYDPPCTPKAYVPPHTGWTPELEAETRLTLETATWESVGGATVDTSPPDCTAPPCIGVAGPGEATTTTTLNRSVPYTLAMNVSSGDGLVVTITELTTTNEEIALASETVPAGTSVPFSLEFELPRAGSATTIHLDPVAEATVDSLSITGEQWTAMDIGPPGDLLRFGFLIHIEESNGFAADEAEWRGKATVLEGLAATLARHGASLTIQPDASFIQAADTWEPGWVEAQTAAGTKWSAHLHYTSGGEDVYRQQVKEARAAFSSHSVTLADINGGYTLGAWGVAADEGYASMTGFKDAETQGGLPSYFDSPWRPPDGSSASDMDTFMTHDPEGPLVYVPGMVGREADHARFEDWATRVLGQAYAHIEPGAVNTWYFLNHVDAFGPPDDLATYLSDGSLERDLAYYDAFLTDVTDPLVASGDLRYSWPDDMVADYLEAEGGCE